MTESLTQGMRIIPSDIGPVIPVCDIVDNIGYTRSAATKAMNRHPTMFNGLTTIQPIDTPTRGRQHVKCLNQEGVKQFILLLTPSPEENPDLCRRVEAFKAQTYTNLAGNAGDGTPRNRTPSILAESLTRNADIADIMISRYGYEPDVAHRIAITNVENEVGDVVLPWKGPAMIPAATGILIKPARCDPSSACFMDEADPDFEKYFSLRKVADYTGQTEDRTRNILEKTGLLSWSNSIWHLTTLGQQFGKVFTTYPLAPHRMTPRKMIRWSPAAVERVKAHVAAGQSQLVSQEA